MKILAIESSTQNLSLSIGEKDKVYHFRNELLKNKLSDKLLTRINKICGSLSEIDIIAIGIGPGSFTSLRVGLSTVKGLLFGTKKKIIGVSSLDVLACNVKEPQAYVSVICDAKRQMVYFAQYKKDNLDIVRVSEYQLIPIKDLKQEDIINSTVIGDGIPLIKNEFKNKTIKWESSSRWYPQAKHLSQLVYKRFQNKDVDDVRTLTPLYLYPQDCQVRS